MNNVDKLREYIFEMVRYNSHLECYYMRNELSLAELKTLRELVNFSIWQRLEEYSPAVFAEGANVKTEGIWK